MQERIIEFFHQNQIDFKATKILLACSGGKDSMCLAHLMQHLNVNFGMAHIDHSTRDGMSHQDEAFVHSFAQQYNIPYYKKLINLTGQLQNSKASFQMLARKERYDFLEKVRYEQSYDFIATAHHRDDNVETLMIRLTRSSGVEGLSGINPVNRFIIRPLLGVAVDDIINYMRIHNVPFREDSSNSTLDYERNIWRNQLIPQIESHFPKFSVQANKSIKHLREANDFISKEISNWLTNNSKINGLSIELDWEELHRHHSSHLLLFNILQAYDFNESQVRDILSFKQVGRTSFSSDYRITLERKNLVISPLSLPAVNYHPLIEGMHIEGLGEVNFSEKKPSSQYLSIELPIAWQSELIIRKWQVGDSFRPKGMGGKTKKLKKYFVDEKYSLLDKEGQWLLLYKDSILWVIDKRESQFQRDGKSIFLYFKK